MTVTAISALIAASPSALATYPGANGDIAFVRKLHVWIVQPDGTQSRIARGDSPAWSPDGTRIAYTRAVENGPTHIWIMDADGTDPVRVTSGPRDDYAPSWSPSGGRLAFTSAPGDGRGADIHVVSARAPFGNPVPVLRTDANEFDVEWAPDGSRLAFAVSGCATGICGWHIGVVDLDGSDRRLLTTSDAVDLDPNWSPDASTILFASTRPRERPGRTLDIFSVPVRDGPAARITNAMRPASNREPIWSPDGTRFAYVHRSANGATSIRSANLDGTSVVRVCRGDPWFESTPTDWQPVAFAR